VREGGGKKTWVFLRVSSRLHPAFGGWPDLRGYGRFGNVTPVGEIKTCPRKRGTWHPERFGPRSGKATRPFPNSTKGKSIQQLR
jgi:hypothetical protein